MGNWKIKKIKYFLAWFSLLSIGTFAQEIKPFAGASAYRHTDFKNSVFGDLRAGLECKITYYFKPEVEINYMFGNLVDLIERDNTGLATSEYYKNVAAVNYSFCPKIILGNKDEAGGDFNFQILPKCTYSSIEAVGKRYTRNPANLSKPIEEIERVMDYQYSLGIGLGLVVSFSDENSDSLALNLYFNNIDFGKALNKLNQDRKFKTDDVLGLGVSYYFTLKKKKTNK